MTAVVGLDYSTKFLHVAIVRDTELLSAKRYALGETVASQTGVITKLAINLIEEHGPLVAYTERPFLLKGGRMNPQTTIMLALLVGAIRGIFTATTHTVELVTADEWRSIVGVTGPDRQAKKLSSIKTARREFPGVEITDDNTADAIGLALYGRQVQHRDALVAQAGAR